MILKRRFGNFLFDLFDMFSFLIFVGWIVLFIRFFVANPYTVVGASMAPTFTENDFIVVDKITSRFGQLSRGDVVVFVPPGKTIPYIKRVVGLPGETVKLVNNRVVICSGTPQNCFTLNESWYLDASVKTEARCGIDTFVVWTWGYFVMGDNRSFSTDSRCCFGLDCYPWSHYDVPFNNVIGKVYVRFYPNFRSF